MFDNQRISGAIICEFAILLIGNRIVCVKSPPNRELFSPDGRSDILIPIRRHHTWFGFDGGGRLTIC